MEGENRTRVRGYHRGLGEGGQQGAERERETDDNVATEIIKCVSHSVWGMERRRRTKEKLADDDDVLVPGVGTQAHMLSITPR